MNDEIERLYQPLAQGMVDVLPEDFRQAWACTEQMEDMSGTDIFYEDAAGAFHHLSYGLEALDDLLIELRAAYKRSGQAVWSTATFWIEASGKFRLDLGYEDVSDFDRGAERFNAWRARYLGPGAVVNEDSA